MSLIRNPIVSLIVIALGNFLFSFNTVVISGVMLFIERDFPMSTGTASLVASIIIVGALLGVCMTGDLANRLGRKKTLILSTLFVIVGTLCAALATSSFQLILGRLIQGIGSGLAFVVVPMYLAEIAPPKNRGAYLIFGSVIGGMGILATYTCNYFLAAEGLWRVMLGAALIPALLQLVGLFLIPESSAWPGESSNTKEKGWKNVFKPQYRKVLSIGALLNVLQQIIGINAIMYFAPRILKNVGEGTSLGTDEGATLGALTIGAIGFISTLCATALVDRFGRRPLLLVSLPGTMSCLIVFCIATWFNLPYLHVISMACLSLYSVFFSLGMAPIPSLIISEIYPFSIRSQAMSLASLANWGGNYLVTLTFLPLSLYFSTSGLFSLYALFALLGAIFVYRNVPETKGKSLEEIQKMKTLFP